MRKYADVEAAEVLTEEQHEEIRKTGKKELPKDPIKSAFKGILSRPDAQRIDASH